MITGGFGFSRVATAMDERFDDKVNRTAVEAARRKFSPEFMNRIDKTVVFKMLRPDDMKHILDIELGMVQQRVLMAAGANQFVFTCTQGVKDYLLREGTDAKHGARHLKRAIERHLVFPLANLVATGQVRLGDFVRIDTTPEGIMTFTKEAEGTALPGFADRYGTAANATAQAARVVRPVVARREFGAPGPILDTK